MLGLHILIFKYRNVEKIKMHNNYKQCKMHMKSPDIQKNDFSWVETALFKKMPFEKLTFSLGLCKQLF